jgi:uncharacterized protein YbjT (DUF2867 family)
MNSSVRRIIEGFASKSHKHHGKQSIMKILITTPGGMIGRTIIPELLAPEFAVRVISRNPHRLPTEIRRQVHIVRGSIDNSGVLREALDGVDALFWCIPRPPIQEINLRAYHERFARAASQAICEADTPRVVSISANPISALHATEEILNDSGAAIRHLRCDWFTGNFSTPATALPADIPVTTTVVTHIADLALRLLVRTDWSGVEALSIPGPDDLYFAFAAIALK